MGYRTWFLLPSVRQSWKNGNQQLPTVGITAVDGRITILTTVPDLAKAALV